MPVENCEVHGQPGKRWGSKGKCYPYVAGNEDSMQRAAARAKKQGRAIKAREGKKR